MSAMLWLPADHRQRSPPHIPLYGTAVLAAAAFGRGGTVVGADWTVGSAIGSSAEREARSAGAAARAAAATAGEIRAGLEGKPRSNSVTRPGGRVPESWRGPASRTGGTDH